MNPANSDLWLTVDSAALAAFKANIKKGKKGGIWMQNGKRIQCYLENKIKT